MMPNRISRLQLLKSGSDLARNCSLQIDVRWERRISDTLRSTYHLCPWDVKRWSVHDFIDAAMKFFIIRDMVVLTCIPRL
jgi:hypothetical protein